MRLFTITLLGIIFVICGVPNETFQIRPRYRRSALDVSIRDVTRVCNVVDFLLFAADLVAYVVCSLLLPIKTKYRLFHRKMEHFNLSLSSHISVWKSINL